MEVCSDKNKHFKGLYFQDKEMKHAFEAYPELVGIDATYKLLGTWTSYLPIIMVKVKS